VPATRKQSLQSLRVCLRRGKQTDKQTCVEVFSVPTGEMVMPLKELMLALVVIVAGYAAGESFAIARDIVDGMSKPVTLEHITDSR
jgi:hypothetical protein